MTQVHDDDLDNVWSSSSDLNWDALTATRPSAPAPGPGAGRQEPLFEQLRSAYLHRDDTNEWARDSDTGGWAADDSGRWEAGVATAFEDDDSRYRWVDAPGDLGVGARGGLGRRSADGLDDLDDGRGGRARLRATGPSGPGAGAVLGGPGGAAADEHAAERLHHPAVRDRGAGRGRALASGSSRPGC